MTAKDAHRDCRAQADGYALLDRLFERTAIRSAVPSDQVERYEVASRHAAKFCAHLVRTHTGNNMQDVMADVRAYYRRGLREKLKA